jgi:hypothetical protein
MTPAMNAHINHDLPLALVQTYEALDVIPDRSRLEYRDFEAVNGMHHAWPGCGGMELYGVHVE